MVNKNILSIKNLIVSFLVIFFILQDFLQEHIAFFQYYDEVISVVVFLSYMFLVFKKGKIKKDNLILLGLALVVVFIGLISNMMSGIVRSQVALFNDIGNTFKFLLVFVGMSEVAPKISSENVIRIVAVFTKIYLLILAVCALLNLTMDIGMSSEVRYGIPVFDFGIGIPGVVINHCTYILVVLMAERVVRNVNNIVFILIDLIVILSTLRSRGIGLIALFVVLYYLLFIMEKKSMKTYIGIIVVMLLGIGASQIENYFFDNSDAPRALFLSNSLQLAKDYFPLGTGFATFGSSAAAEYYSPLYYELGFNTKYGMGPTESMFLNDNYWPTILGQFGVFGVIVFGILLYKYFRKFQKTIEMNTNKESRLIFWFVTFDALMSSIQSSYISHYSMVALMFITMICFGDGGILRKRIGATHDNRN